MPGFHFTYNRRAERGFTLIELLVVIAMISMLFVMGGASYVNSQRQGRNVRKQQDLKKIQQALEAHYSVLGTYPGGTCDPGVNYLSQGMPKNPQTQAVYAPNTCTATSYCFCVQLEGTTTGGNSTVANCTNYSAGSYFCVNNLQ